MTVRDTLECDRLDRVTQRTQQALVSAVAVRERLDRIVGDLRSRCGSDEAPEGGWRCRY